MTTRTHSLHFITESWLKAARSSGLLNLGSHQIWPVCSNTPHYSIRFLQTSNSDQLFRGCRHFSLYLVLSGCQGWIDCESRRGRRRVSGASLFTLPVVQGCRKSCYRRAAHAVAPRQPPNRAKLKRREANAGITLPTPTQRI